MVSAADPGRRRATYQDLEDVPVHQVGEILDGTLVVSPRPATRHAWASSQLGVDLGSAFMRGRGGPGGWIILDEPELHLGPEPDVLVPDLAGWREERMPDLPDAAFLTLPPDWVGEVLSPSTESHDRAGKLPIYARERVGHVWLLNPGPGTLEVLRLEPPTWRLVSVHRGHERVRAEPFDALELDLSLLFAHPTAQR